MPWHKQHQHEESPGALTKGVGDGIQFSGAIFDLTKAARTTGSIFDKCARDAHFERRLQTQHAMLDWQRHCKHVGTKMTAAEVSSQDDSIPKMKGASLDSMIPKFTMHSQARLSSSFNQDHANRRFKS